MIDAAMSRCWGEIDLDKVAYNVKNALGLLRGTAKLLPVLKANAYGLGAVEIARLLRTMDIRFYAVASFAEAYELKTAFPDCEVLVLGLTGRPQMKAAVEAGIIQTLFSKKQADELKAAAREAGRPARVHVKVETGLNRLGFSPEEAVSAYLAAEADPDFSAEGLFSHLALRSREADEQQFRLFDRTVEAIRSRGCRIPALHIADSIGMVRYPERHMDYVRTGAWLYGNCPSRYEHPELCLPALTFKCRIAEIHEAPAGSYLGYDEDHPIARDSVIATLSCGYIDGYPRLNGVGEVEIRGKRAPVCGLVCMDQMMVDVTDIPDAREGDEVILLGSTIGVIEYAGWGHLNRNEALARLNRRVPRVYFRNGRPAYVTADMDGLVKE